MLPKRRLRLYEITWLVSSRYSGSNMKIASFYSVDGEDFGIVSGDGIISLKKRLPATKGSLRAAIANGLTADLGRIAADAKPDLLIEDVKFAPVIPSPNKFIAVGINYRDHAQQIERKVEAFPGIFVRFPDSLVGHLQPMIRPRISTQFDFEGELALIIGKRGRYIAEDHAMQYVAGYTCFVDGSLRDYQKLATTAGKNFPSTGPFGPWMVTADEIPDPGRMVLTTRLNGLVVQHAGVDEMIHSIPKIISYISQFTELRPGDVISTGTPGGVGHRRNPPIWLKSGDTLEFEISGIGILSNPIVDEA